MRKSISDLLKTFKYDQECAENAIDFVRNLLEEDVLFTKETEPNATTSIYEMELAARRVQLLTDSVVLDMDVKWLMDTYSFDESDIDELEEEFTLTAVEISRKFQMGDMVIYSEYGEFFEAAHENMDNYDLIRLLKDNETALDRIQYMELGGKYIWKKY